MTTASTDRAPTGGIVAQTRPQPIGTDAALDAAPYQVRSALYTQDHALRWVHDRLLGGACDTPRGRAMLAEFIREQCAAARSALAPRTVPVLQECGCGEAERFEVPLAEYRAVPASLAEIDRLFSIDRTDEECLRG